MDANQKALNCTLSGGGTNDPIVVSTMGGSNVFDALESLHREAEGRAITEEFKERRRRVVHDWSRISRLAKAFEEELAPQRLSANELKGWREWHAYDLIPGPAMRKGMEAQRRLAPEAAEFEDRMHAVLLKHANVPYGQAWNLLLVQYWNLLDIAAESVEQAAYPGSGEARKRYALALRRCARELREPNLHEPKAVGHAMWRARVTLQLSLDDGTLGLWDSSQALVDFVGLKGDGKSQDVKAVSDAAWRFIWDYAVVSRLRQVCPNRFSGIPDHREHCVDEMGHILGDSGPLLWTWDGFGSGMLTEEAALNADAECALREAMDETGIPRLWSSPGWEETYEQTSEYRAYREREAVLHQGTRAVACDALADVLDHDFHFHHPKFISPMKWDELDDEGFERLIFTLVSNAPGYSNVAWLMQTRATDRGRDLSAIRTSSDPLIGDRHLRIIFQCKHWRSRCVGIDELPKLVGKMSLWTPPAVDELIIATSGRFSSDAVQWIEKHNLDSKNPYVVMWPGSHLEALLAGD